MGRTLPESIRSAIGGQWGNPAREARFDTRSVVVEVLKYLASATGEGVTTYLTITHRPPEPHPHLSEFIVGLDDSKDEIADPLARLAVYSAGAPIHHATTIETPPLWRGTAMRRFLVMQPRVPVVGPFEFDGQLVQYLSAIPVFESEIPAMDRLGADGFMAELRKHSLGFWETKRKPLPMDLG